MITRTKVESIIGKGYADKLDSPVFVVTDKWQYSHRVMVDMIGCANFIAAAKLAKVLKKLNVISVGKLFALDPVSLARTKGIGESSIFVAMCILSFHEFDVMEWWNNETKFSAVKKARKNRHEV